MIGGLTARHTVTRLRGVEEDDGHGNTETNWDEPDELDIAGCAVDAGSTEEDLQNRDGSRVEYTVRGPLDADIRAGDRVLLPWETDPLDVDGGVLRQPGPTSRTSHCIVRLTRWAG